MVDIIRKLPAGKLEEKVKTIQVGTWVMGFLHLPSFIPIGEQRIVTSAAGKRGPDHDVLQHGDDGTGA